MTPVLAARKLKIRKKNILITFGQTKCIFVTTKVEALIFQYVWKIMFLIQKHRVGSYGDTLLKERTEHENQVIVAESLDLGDEFVIYFI